MALVCQYSKPGHTVEQVSEIRFIHQHKTESLLDKTILFLISQELRNKMLWIYYG